MTHRTTPAFPSRRRALPTALLCAALAGAAAAAPVETPARLRIGIERVELPGGEGMGLVGTSYLLELAPDLWFGPAAYGAISGERGGLFTLGVEGAWRRPIGGPLVVELGYYAGGGGGGAAPVGGGLMLRPHVDLLWRSAIGELGLSWSQVRFANGEIDSRQLGLVWNVATAFRHLPGAAGDWDGSRSSGLGFDRIQAVLGAYRPGGGQRQLDGDALASRIGYAGARAERDFAAGPWGTTAYWGLEATGAASGGVSGYAEYLATVGAQTRGAAVDLGARLALGMGGGGSVDVGGGLLWKAGAYVVLPLTETVGVTVEGGYARAPQGSFRAPYGTLALNWQLEPASAYRGPPARMEWVGGVESYPAARRDGSTRRLQAVALRINRWVASQIYLSAQAHSALGGEAGGFSVGLLGAGWRGDFAPRWHGGVELLAGAAGGGGVDTEGGAIAQPMAYLGYELSPGLAVRVGAGRIRGWRGPLDGGVVELSLAYGFGVSGR
jgi:hypothetical protein